MKIILLLLLTTFSFTTLHADENEVEEQPNYTSPVPTLMRLVVKNKDILELTKEQGAELKKWRRTHLRKAIDDIKKSHSIEDRLHQSAIGGKPTAEVQVLLDQAVAIKKQVWENKLRCRDVIKKVLDEDQWGTLVALYAQKMSAKE